MYKNQYKYLKEQVSYDQDILLPDNQIGISNYVFNSHSYNILPGNTIYHCDSHSRDFSCNVNPIAGYTGYNDQLEIHDFDISENKKFKYQIFKPVKIDKAKNIILFLHGFNEKSWDKYLPWAHKLAIETGNAVVMFPIAFHMNRAPQLWSDPRNMFELSRKRKNNYSEILESTFSNVAISSRLHACPQRFLWSGLQTYYDVIQFLAECKKGTHPIIDQDFTFNIFAYSIGGFLAEILKLSNYNNWFGQSKLAMFCGGAVFNRFSPVSKFILDSEANMALYSYLIEHLSVHLQREPRLEHFLGGSHAEGNVFRSMLCYASMREYRESLFRNAAADIMAVSLEKDSVVPCYEIKNTLQGARRDIPIQVEVFDFEYEYRHEDPFPVKGVDDQAVDKAFNMVFEPIVKFLKP